MFVYSPAATPRKWLRIGFLVAAMLIWILVISLPMFAFLLATRGELTWKRGNYTTDRVWLVMEQREGGVGWEATRVESQLEDKACLTTTVRFLLWKGDASVFGTSYCECYSKQPDQSLEYLDACKAD